MINSIEITIPFDTSIIEPGDIENSLYVIYHAESLEEFEAGNISTVPVSDIIDVDYLKGEATFQVSHLSVFGIGEGDRSVNSDTTTGTQTDNNVGVAAGTDAGVGESANSNSISEGNTGAASSNSGGSSNGGGGGGCFIGAAIFGF